MNLILDRSRYPVRARGLSRTLFDVPSSSGPPLYSMAETKQTFTLHYTVVGIDLSGLKRLIKEVKSITGMKPDKILDSENVPVKV